MKPLALFYTDFGEAVVGRRDDGTEINVGRYAAWVMDRVRCKAQVIESGDDLPALKARWGEAKVFLVLGGNVAP